MTSHPLELRSVSLALFDVPGRSHVLTDISLEVAPGELVAITGRSGSGKSSLLNVAGGLILPTQGEVLIDGERLAELSGKQRSAKRRRSVGYVFQDLNLIPSLTALENVSLPLELDKMSTRCARREAMRSLEMIEIADLAERYPDELSGGERQRVAIARGLVGNRTLLLADEPTGALDEITAEGIMGVLRDACADGAAALLVTHDPSLAAWADKVVRLRDGRIDSVSQRSDATFSTTALMEQGT